MKPATTSKRNFEKTKLLVVDGKVRHAAVGDLARLLAPGDLLVVNRSGTLPASFRGSVERSGEAIEIRLAAFRGAEASDLREWAAVAFGEGDWRQPTEQRGPAPRLHLGDRLLFGKRLRAQITAIDPEFPRLLRIAFDSPDLVRDLYRQGRPIQYAYLEEELAVWDQQTLFSGPPISVEPPSAAFPFNWSLMRELRAQGVRVATLLHGAGLSSTGEAKLDARFPLSEYFEIPAATLRAVTETRAQGKRVIALGTTVARALESAFEREGQPLARGYTELKLGPERRLKATSTLVTGMHEEGTSHAELMKAFCGCEVLREADREANAQGYRAHEYGDLALLDCLNKRK